MGITFVTVGLAAGAALAAIPLILHLLMRQSPNPVVFPALWLIRERSQKARKQIKIKNWLLLIARMALIALMALALARPAYNSQASLGDREVPTALALVFDTSLSMQYTERDQDRLSEAKKRAEELLAKTHEASHVFVIDSADPGVPMSLSPAAARKSVETRTLRPVNRKLNAAMGQAFAAVLGSDRPRKEVFVLSDLTRPAWDPQRPVDGLDKVEKANVPIPTYLLRLGVKEPVNVGLADAQVRSTAGIIAVGEPAQIDGVVRATGPAVERTIEFYLDGPTKRDQKVVEIPANGEVTVSFRTPALEAGLHTGRLHIAGTDPMPFDDDRHVTFEVRKPFRVLVLADLNDDLDYAAGALDPPDPPEGLPRAFTVDRFLTARFPERSWGNLRDYACVILNNVRKVDENAWSSLSSYVANGGGLIIGLGNRVDAASYSEPTPTRLLPATLNKVIRPDGGRTSFGKADYSHPIFAREQSEVANLDADLAGVSVTLYQGVTPNTTNARTLLAFQDGAPALLERDVPGPRPGHVLLFTVPLSARNRADDPAAWTDWPLPPHWSFLDVLTQAVPYLAGATSERWNYQAGEFISVNLDPSKRFTSLLVRGPGDTPANRLGAPAGRSSLLIEPPQALGQGQITATAADGQTSNYGFSVNADPAESVLTSLTPAELDELFGKGRYAVAEDTESLKRAISEVRIGHEVFPWLLLLVLALITAENLLANRFHRERNTAAPVPAGRAA